MKTDVEVVEMILESLDGTQFFIEDELSSLLSNYRITNDDLSGLELEVVSAAGIRPFGNFLKLIHDHDM